MPRACHEFFNRLPGDALRGGWLWNWAAQVAQFHRELFANNAVAIREEIKRITGVEVREAAAQVEPSTGTVLAVFATGTIVQVFLLKSSISAAAWNETGPMGPNDKNQPSA